MPTLTAKQISNGVLKDYWVRLGLYQVILIFEVNEEELVVDMPELFFWFFIILSVPLNTLGFVGVIVHSWIQKNEVK